MLRILSFPVRDSYHVGEFRAMKSDSGTHWKARSSVAKIEPFKMLLNSMPSWPIRHQAALDQDGLM